MTTTVVLSDAADASSDEAASPNEQGDCDDTDWKSIAGFGQRGVPAHFRGDCSVSSFASIVLVELTSAGFTDFYWAAGQKLQIRTSRETFNMRTYTPTRWNPAQGSTELIAFTHGTGPAAAWFQSVRAGDSCEVFGPRKSLSCRFLCPVSSAGWCGRALL